MIDLARPSAGELAVWSVHRHDPALARRLAGVLSHDERVRAELFRFARDRDAFVVSRGTLRVLLCGALGIAPAAVTFTYGPHGKPAVDGDPDLGFNLSHAGDVTVVAIAPGTSVGVDVEPLHAVPEREAIAARVFSERDVDAIRAAPDADRDRVFLSIWIRAEALLKASGTGWADSVADPAVSPVEPERTNLQELELGPGYLGAVAYEGRPRPVRPVTTLGAARILAAF